MPGLADLITGAVSGLGDTASKIIDSINAPKAMKDQMTIDLQKSLDEHQNALLQADVENEKLHAEEKQALLLDVQNARNTNAAIQSTNTSSWLAKNIPYCLAIFMTAIWGGATWFVIDKMFISPPSANTGQIALMYGGISTLFGTVLNYYFGSTHSSKEKDATIAAQAATISAS